jgi:hypothetical protein
VIGLFPHKFIEGTSKFHNERASTKPKCCVNAKESGHNVHMQQPEVIAEEVRWILDSF